MDYFRRDNIYEDDENKKIYLKGNLKVNKIIFTNDTIYLSDFKYTALDGKEYTMIIKEKGYHGSYHVIKLIN